MPNIYKYLWDTGSSTSYYLGTSEGHTRRLKFVLPILIFFLGIAAIVAILCYLVFSTFFTKKLNDDANLEKLYNKNAGIAALEAEQLSTIRYFENYRMAYDGAVLALLSIICLINIYYLMKSY